MYVPDFSFLNGCAGEKEKGEERERESHNNTLSFFLVMETNQPNNI